MQQPQPSPTATGAQTLPDDVGEATRRVLETVGDLVQGFLANLPPIGIALVLSVTENSAGMTIPWPIRTLVMDGPVELDRDGRARSAT